MTSRPNPNRSASTPSDATPESSLADSFIALLQSKTPEGASLVIPPPCFVDMRGEILDVDAEAGRLVVRFPNQARFRNPVGFMQGGMIGAALDNVFGPLTYLMGWTALTTQLQVRFLKPVTPDIEAVTVRARIDRSDGPQLFVSGVVTDGKDVTFAVGHAQFRSTPKARSSSSSNAP